MSIPPPPETDDPGRAIVFKGIDLSAYVEGPSDAINAVKGRLEEVTGGQLFHDEMMKSVTVYVPKTRPSPLLLLHFASVGVNVTNDHLDLMKTLCFSIQTPGDIFLATEDTSIFKPMLIKIVDVPVIQSIQTIVSNLGSDIKRASAAVAPALSIDDIPSSVSVESLSQTCEMMIAISHRLSKLNESQLNALGQTSPIIKSGTTFFPRADILLLKTLAIHMYRNSAWRRFSIGHEVVRNAALLWESIRRKTGDSYLRNAVSFFSVGLRGSGFLALTLLHQTSVRLKMEYSDILTSIGIRVAEILYLLIKARMPMILSKESWYLYCHILFPHCVCEFSASSHPEMCYIFYGIVGEQIDQEVDFSKVGAWIQEIPIPVQQRLSAISRVLATHGGAGLEPSLNILRVTEQTDKRTKEAAQAIKEITKVDDLTLQLYQPRLYKQRQLGSQQSATPPPEPSGESFSIVPPGQEK